jgi:ATP-dependent Clp protease protease subunit
MNLQILSAAALFAFAGALPATAQEPAAKPAAAVPAKPPTPEQAELTKLTTENQLAEQLLKKKLQQANAEKEELKSAYELDQQKQKAKTAALEAGLALASAENRLAEEKNRQLMLELSMKLARLKADNDLKAEQQRAESLADAKERGAIELDLKRLDLEERRLKLEKIALDNRAAKLASDLELRNKKAEWKKESNSEPVYTHAPYKNGKLTLSDRRIPLNGPIIQGAATYVSERINYFNNISTQPIFIVIDDSPGGSTWEGYAIIKAMESSKAPVYVVVKSMAASMAAIIATMAEKSYAYPGAQILHHQMWGPASGNLIQLNEKVAHRKEWEKRLYGPLSKKIGLSLEEFRKKMYENNSEGDWLEFGDKAAEYKWVTGTIDRLEETGIIKNPEENSQPKSRLGSFAYALEEKTDEKGQVFVPLPRLRPFDYYLIYNPDNYYRQ